MNEKNQNLKRDLVGVALFAAGAFLSVVVATCYVQGAAASDYAGVTVVDKELIRWFGRPACLVLGVVACGIGARMFLVGSVARLGRTLGIGGACLALGTSILMGALNPDYGGVFGQLIGTWASENLSKVVGIPLGLVCVFVPVWFAWLRPAEGDSEKGVREPAPSADRSTDASPGVTAEEAAELIPRRIVPREAVAPAAAKPAPARPLDPQQKAPVPPGAAPLATHHEPFARPHPSQAPAMLERPPADLPFMGVAAGEDLAREPAAEESGGKRSLVVHPVDELEEVGPALPLTSALPPAASVPSERASALPPEAPAGPEALDVDEPSGASPLPTASWEQGGETVDDLPVDAYGTPLTLVEELRRDSTVRAASAKEEALEEAAREAGVDDGALELEAADEEAPRFEVVAAAALVADDDEEEDDEAEFDAELARTQASEALAKELAGEPTVALPALFDDVELEESEEATEEEDEELEDDAADDAEDTDEALRREAPLFAAPRPAKAATDAVSTVDEAEDETEETEPAAPVAERDVVLQPRAAPAPDAALDEDEPEATVEAEPKAPTVVAEISDEDELVFKAGMLFLERQRVAVSMLQREFGLDFEQATRVLDRLQAAGLIGPYLGGQRRDILLTLEQWRSRAVAR